MAHPRVFSLKYGWLTLLLLLGLAGCQMPVTPAPGPAATPTLPPAPTIRLVEPSRTLCQAATQLRRNPLVMGSWPRELTAAWEILPADDDTPLSTGSWTPEQGPLLATFPESAPLPSGRYTLRLTLADQTVTQPFTITAAIPQIIQAELALTPGSPAVTELPSGVQHFYVRYSYAGACQGAPLWLTVQQGEQIICTAQIALEEERATDAIPCYQADTAPLPDGEDYQLTLNLMGEQSHELRFRVGAPPVAVTPYCEPLFTAAGIAPDGTPLHSSDRFEWYVQTIYLGTHCTTLEPGAAWEARWYRNNELLRTATGQWTNPAVPVVWDSLPGTPFILYGTYSATLALEGLAPLTTTFQVVPYVPATPAP